MKRCETLVSLPLPLPLPNYPHYPTTKLPHRFPILNHPPTHTHTTTLPSRSPSPSHPLPIPLPPAPTATDTTSQVTPKGRTGRGSYVIHPALSDPPNRASRHLTIHLARRVDTQGPLLGSLLEQKAHFIHPPSHPTTLSPPLAFSYLLTSSPPPPPAPPLPAPPPVAEANAPNDEVLPADPGATPGPVAPPGPGAGPPVPTVTA